MGVYGVGLLRNRVEFLHKVGLGRSIPRRGAPSGLPDEPIPSGAGHAAAVFANAGIPSAMIFVRNENGSHNPFEA